MYARRGRDGKCGEGVGHGCVGVKDVVAVDMKEVMAVGWTFGWVVWTLHTCCVAAVAIVIGVIGCGGGGEQSCRLRLLANSEIGALE